MNSQPPRERTGLAYVVGVLGAFLIIAALVWATRHYTQPAPLGEDLAAKRAKALADMHAAETEALTTPAWVDQGKGIVRLPVDVAVTMVQEEWGRDPAAGRKDLIAREEKATAVPPKAPAKPNPYE